MKIVDLDTWERAEHYRFFRRMDYPQYSISAQVDVTAFLDAVRSRKLPFYYAMIEMALRATDDVPAFRYRIRDEQVVLHERIHPAFTDMKEGSDLFRLVLTDRTNPGETVAGFALRAQEKSRRQDDSFPYAELADRDDLIYITCIPWVSFTHLSHTITLNSGDAVPRIAWGRYSQAGDKVLLPFSVQAHHAFVDGVHMGRYFDRLQDHLNAFSNQEEE